MFQRGIRGAITVTEDNSKMVEDATVRLCSEIFTLNNIKIEDISHVIFTTTKDIKSAYPAKFLREHFFAQNVPLMCMQESDIENSLEKCIRVLVVVNTEMSQNEIRHVYLDGAKILRPDLAN